MNMIHRFFVVVIFPTTAVFGATSVVITLADAVLHGSSLFTSDDPYIIGGAVAIALSPGVLIYHLLQEYSPIIYRKYIAYLMWVIVLLLYFSIGYFLSQEYKGEILSLALVTAGASVIAFMASRIVGRKWICLVLNIFSVMYLLAYGLVLTIHY